MKLKTSFLVLKTDNTVTENASRLRGYIGNKFKEYSVLHHHIKEMGYLYTYPRVQYRVIGGTASILGIEEGAEVLKKISDELGELLLNNSRYRIKQKVFYEQEVEVRPSGKRQYRFVMPWLALNPDNYMAYQNMNNWKEKKEFLNSILVGNILSMCKGLGIVVDSRLYTHSYLDTVKVEYKGVPHLGFTGEFRVNFIIPDFFGLGKGVSQGFGVVKNAPSDR